jgi:hypothetical protein
MLDFVKVKDAPGRATVSRDYFSDGILNESSGGEN